MTEEMIVEKWHRVAGVYRHNQDVIQWLESDAMQGRWCMPGSGVAHGLYFELEEDRMLFSMLWT
jgi:hypothetical protein